MLIHVLFLDIAIKVRRAVSNDVALPPPPTNAKSRTYANGNVETIIETLGKYQSRVTEGEIIQTFTHRTGYSDGFAFSSKTRYYR